MSRRCAYNYSCMQVRAEAFRGEQCNKLQPSTIDLFTVNARITLLGGLVYAKPCKFYIAPIYSRHFEAVHLATKRIPRCNGNRQ